MTAPLATAPYASTSIVPAGVLYYCAHDWPQERECQRGVRPTCATCQRQFAPCSRTPVSVADVMGKTWRCPAHQETAS